MAADKGTAIFLLFHASNFKVITTLLDTSMPNRREQQKTLLFVLFKRLSKRIIFQLSLTTP